MISPETIKKAKDAIKTKAEYEYFFSKLSSADWIEPLKKYGGFFTNPPKIREENGYIITPVWPESQYLTRMAKLAPEIVMEVINNIPDDHSNILIYQDFVEAALDMPADMSVKLLEKFKLASKMRYGGHSLLGMKIGDLISHLAKNEYVKEAISLSKTILKICPEIDEVDEDGEPSFTSLNSWEYQQIIKKNIPDIFVKNDLETIALFCRFLDSHIKLYRKQWKIDSDKEDYSFSWRPAIEDHSQNRDASHGLSNILVEAIRDFGELFLNNKPDEFPSLLEILRKYPWKIFLRLELHFLRISKPNVDLLSSRLVEKNNFDDVHVRHEYALLLFEHFAKLDLEQQSTVLGFVRNSEDEIALDALCWFEESNLPDDLKQRKSNLVSKLGKPEHPEFSYYSYSGWVGPTSPKTEDELKTVSSKEIVEFLRLWKPKDGFQSASPNGLGRVLNLVISSNLSSFIDLIEEFKSLDPTYVRALIEGAEGAVKDKKEVEWGKILELCKWVINQPINISNRTVSREFFQDPDWSWSQKSVVKLISRGLEKQYSEIPFEFRELVWGILDLIRVIEPSQMEEIHDTFDPVFTSINSTRGESLHSVIKYALWVNRHIEKMTFPEGNSQVSFSLMPEVRNALNFHLDTNNEKSLSTWSVYGQWFPWLALLDEDWAKEKVNIIFPEDEAAKEYWEAAWYAYIVYCSPYDNILNLLKEKYAFAIKKLKSSSRIKQKESDGGLSKHLMVFYYRGKLEIDFLEGFWSNADEPIRMGALNFFGTSLQQPSVTDAMIVRAKKLWESRMKVAKEKQNFRNEMSCFSVWFSSRKFDTVWALDTLKESLSISKKIKRDSKHTLEYLSELAESFPKEVSECLDLIVRNTEEIWQLSYWKGEIEILLKKLLKTSEKKKAKDIIHVLGSKGLFEFRDLLKNE